MMTVGSGMKGNRWISMEWTDVRSKGTDNRDVKYVHRSQKTVLKAGMRIEKSSPMTQLREECQHSIAIKTGIQTYTRKVLTGMEGSSVLETAARTSG